MSGDGRHQALVDAAIAAREHAIAPYSGYAVGAALLTDAGELVPGCNVENASYGLTMCAERVALYAALSRGLRSFRGVAVATGGDEPASPCGPCRQLLWEYAGDIPVVLVAAKSGATETIALSTLLPRPFTLEPQ